MTIGNMKPDNLIAGNYPAVAVPVSVQGSDVVELRRGDVVALVDGFAVMVDSESASDEGGHYFVDDVYGIQEQGVS